MPARGNTDAQGPGGHGRPAPADMRCDARRPQPSVRPPSAGVSSAGASSAGVSSAFPPAPLPPRGLHAACGAPPAQAAHEQHDQRRGRGEDDQPHHDGGQAAQKPRAERAQALAHVGQALGEAAADLLKEALPHRGRLPLDLLHAQRHGAHGDLVVVGAQHGLVRLDLIAHLAQAALHGDEVLDRLRIGEDAHERLLLGAQRGQVRLGVHIVHGHVAQGDAPVHHVAKAAHARKERVQPLGRDARDDLRAAQAGAVIAVAAGVGALDIAARLVDGRLERGQELVIGERLHLQLRVADDLARGERLPGGLALLRGVGRRRRLRAHLLRVRRVAPVHAGAGEVDFSAGAAGAPCAVSRPALAQPHSSSASESSSAIREYMRFIPVSSCRLACVRTWAVHGRRAVSRPERAAPDALYP